MADPLVIHADLQTFLCDWYREALHARPEDICQAAEVGAMEPTVGSFPAALVVITVVDLIDTSLLTADASVSISVLAGTLADPRDANALSLIVHALRTQIPSVDPENPVAAIVDSHGPSPVPEDQDRARRLINMTLSVVPSLLAA